MVSILMSTLCLFTCSIPSKSQQLWCLVPPAASGVYYTAAVSNVGGASIRTQHELFIKNCFEF